MRRYVICMLLAAYAASSAPSQAQFLKKLGEEFLGGAQQGQQQGVPGAQGSPMPAGTTSLPAGQYMLTNMQTGQGFYLMVNNNGQMFVSSPAAGQQQMMPGMAPQTMAPGQVPQQQSQGFGGMMKNSLGSFLKDQLIPAQQQPQAQFGQ